VREREPEEFMVSEQLPSQEIVVTPERIDSYDALLHSQSGFILEQMSYSAGVSIHRHGSGQRIYGNDGRLHKKGRSTHVRIALA
jgi:hypothetical protein